MSRRALADPGDQREIVSPEDGPPTPAGGLLKESIREHDVAPVHVALARERDAGRLVVRALHEADRRSQGQQPHHVVWGAAQIRLQAYPDVVVLGPRAPEQSECDVHVARLLHIDPEKGAALLGASDERVQRLLARGAVYLESQVRELDGQLDREPARPHLAQYPQVMVAYGGRVRGGRDLFPELGEDAADAGARELGGGRERGIDVLPWEETPYRAPEEGAVPELVREPGAARGAQQQPAGEGHGAQ